MPSSPYESFAPVYPQANHEEVPLAFLAELRKRGLLTKNTGHVLELGCGSGMLVELLAAHSGSVMGIDLSAAMLRLARRRCRQLGRRVDFCRGDLTRMPEVAPGELAVACNDVVNHLRPGQVRAMMRGAYRVLLPGGKLAFDALNRFCFETYWNDKIYFLEGRGGDLVMDCSWNAAARRAAARMVSYVKVGARRVQKRTTVLHEYFHENASVQTALEDAGFVDICAHPWSPWKDQDTEPSLDRTFWIATKKPAASARGSRNG